MLVQRVLILLWKYLLVKEEDLFYWWKESKFLLTALFANARRDNASKFSGWKYGHFETPTTKTDSLTFLENKRLFARTTYIRLLIYLKDIYGQKMKEIEFSTLATRWSIFPVDRRCKFCIYIYTWLLNSIPLLYTVEMACRKNIILRQIKQRNTNLLAGEFAWFDHKFRPRLRRPYFNSFARDTQSILVLAGMSSAYLISGSIPGTNPEVSRVSHFTWTPRQNLYACARLSIFGLFFRHIFWSDRARLHFVCSSWFSCSASYCSCFWLFCSYRNCFYG